MDYNANICLRLNCQEKPTDKFKQYGIWVIFLSNHQNILNKFTSVENFKEKKNTFNHIHKTRSLTNINANINYKVHDVTLKLSICLFVQELGSVDTVIMDILKTEIVFMKRESASFNFADFF